MIRRQILFLKQIRIYIPVLPQNKKRHKIYKTKLNIIHTKLQNNETKFEYTNYKTTNDKAIKELEN